MKKTLAPLALAALLMAAGSCSKKEDASVNQTETTQESAPVARREATAVQVSYSVESVDAEKRLITLKGPKGNTGTYEVGDQVQRLSEIKAGDTIHAEYTVRAVTEPLPPTAEEKGAPSTEVTDIIARGTSEAPPAGGVGRVVRAVASIESMDPTAQSVTVKGPEMGLVTVHVEDLTVFSKLKVGDPIVVTFSEKLVLTVQPRAKG